MIKKADIILAVFLAVLCAVSLYAASAAGRPGDTVTITAEGSLYGTYNLYDNRKITVESNGHLNTVEIQGGAVRMTEADCGNQDCVRAGSIHLQNQTIVCLPNRVMVEITGGTSQIDVISY